MANGNGKRSKKKRYIIIGGIILAVIILVVVLVAATGGGKKIDDSKVKEVTRETIAKSVVATGKVQPITQTDIKSKASGIVQKWYVDAGATVKTGTVLVDLDKQEITAQVQEARAQVEGSQANLKASEADYERAKADAESPEVPLLKRAYDRAQSMAKEGVVSQSNLDDAQKNYELALNKQNMARASLGVAKSKVAQAKALLAQNQASLSRYEEQLRNSTIVSPMDGVVLSRNVENGDAVSSILVQGSSATLVMTVGDVHQVYVKGKVDESDIGKVSLGQPARIKVESFKDETFNGKVTKISPMGAEKDNVTTFEVQVSIDNASGKLKAGMTANAEIVLDEHANALVIPESALLYDKDKKASVEVVDAKAKDGKRKVDVKVGIANGSKAEILAGLKEKDKVILQ